MRSDNRLAATLLVLATVGCQDRVPPGPADSGLSQLGVTYVCGNDYDLQNQSSLAMTVRYAVLGTLEDGELVLPPRAAGTESTTRLTAALRRG
jgi:hypothetical protein